MSAWAKRASVAVTFGAFLLPVAHHIELHLPAPPPDKTTPEWRIRDDALARAQVVVRQQPSIVPADLLGEPAIGAADASPLSCRYVPRPTRATSPKFDCQLPGGELIKIKYDTPEIQAEAAGTRLLRALGFAADFVSIVPRVRCLGCPPAPFQLRRTFEYYYIGPALEWLVDADRPRDFDWVGVERKFPGRAFEFDDVKGWSYADLALPRVDRGGASRAEVDGLRLVTALLGHWDNKPENQRLVCRDDPDGDDSAEPCLEPVMLMHDLGNTFGTKRLHLQNWRAQRIWSDRNQCRVTLDTLRGPGTFVPVEITEAGRQWLSTRLTQLSAAELAAWFLAARFPRPGEPGSVARDVSPWVGVFRAKVREIADGAPCPQ